MKRWVFLPLLTTAVISNGSAQEKMCLELFGIVGLPISQILYYIYRLVIHGTWSVVANISTFVAEQPPPILLGSAYQSSWTISATDLRPIKKSAQYILIYTLTIQ